MNKTLSIRAANLLFLLSMALVLTAGSAIQSIHLSAGLIATEALLILLPALVFLRANHIPWKEGLRLNPIRPATALASLLLGITTFAFTIFIEAIMAVLTRMQAVDIPASSLPTGVFDSILFFIALAIFAPICEEILFRGALQASYEAHRPLRFAITITALMFAFYHFRLSGLPALIPVSFILGFVAWRTRSIYASMLVHFGMNASSAAHTLTAIHVNGTGVATITHCIAIPGLIASAGLLVLIARLNPVTEPAPSVESPALNLPTPMLPTARRTWMANYWPLFVAGLLYLGIAALTLQHTSTLVPRNYSNFEFSPIVPEHAIVSHYQITNRADKVVGKMTCTITPQGTNIHLDCSSKVEGYEVALENSYFKDSAHTANWSATWDSQTMNLLFYIYERETADNESSYRATSAGDWLNVSRNDKVHSIQLDNRAFLEYEWPWRAGMMRTEAGDAWKIELGILQEWNEFIQDSMPVCETKILWVTAGKPLHLPAGDFTVRQFTLAGQSAWYARDDPGFPRPVKFDDGMLTYSLLP